MFPALVLLRARAACRAFDVYRSTRGFLYAVDALTSDIEKFNVLESNLSKSARIAGLAQSELRRIFCSDEGVVVRIQTPVQTRFDDFSRTRKCPRSNGLAQSELRRIFCSDEGVVVRVSTTAPLLGKG